jgi:Leucine-rich repeat (LRR) protein
MNKLRGEIPRCVFPAMATQESINEKSSMEFHTIKESLSIYLFVRKSYDRYKGYFANLKVIDLSSNYLTQGIPASIEKLVELVSLNLSRNQLVGSIPSNIGELQSLEFLDLSRNHLSCDIPTSMANIDRLSMLDLSYNTLSGKIPTATQLQTFDGGSYGGVGSYFV